MMPVHQTITLISTDPPGGVVEELQWLDCDPLNGKHDVIRLRVTCAGGAMNPYKITLKPHLAFTVSAENVELYEGKVIGVQLDRFILAVERVIDRFDAEFC